MAQNILVEAAQSGDESYMIQKQALGNNMIDEGPVSPSTSVMDGVSANPSLSSYAPAAISGTSFQQAAMPQYLTPGK